MRYTMYNMNFKTVKLFDLNFKEEILFGGSIIDDMSIYNSSLVSGTLFNTRIRSLVIEKSYLTPIIPKSLNRLKLIDIYTVVGSFTINLYNLGIESFEIRDCKTPNLKMNLWNNQITNLTMTNSTLNTLDMSNNLLKSDYIAIESTFILNQFILSGNRIQTLSDNWKFECIYATLDLQNNPIEKVDYFPACFQLNLQNMQINQRIPDIPNGINSLFIQNNQFYGTITSFPSTLYTFNAKNNQLSGQLPTLPNKLLNFILSNNQFNGTINLFNLNHNIANDVYMDISNNQFTGSIDFPSQQGLNLNISNNQFNGHLSIISKSGNYFLDATNNQFTGDVSFYGQMVYISNNSFDGMINLPNVLCVNAKYNQFKSFIINKNVLKCDLSNNPFNTVANFTLNGICIMNDMLPLEKTISTRNIVIKSTGITISTLKYESITQNVPQSTSNFTFTNTSFFTNSSNSPILNPSDMANLQYSALSRCAISILLLGILLNSFVVHLKKLRNRRHKSENHEFIYT
eukprot:NODE_346_length_9038_cov_0.304508.p2 type:complete len:515 gc:universal NODE_346_length_9038_cov_0.304508:6448-7992(+)